MLKTIRGLYADGEITLEEIPEGINRAEVLVTFTNARPLESRISFGMFRKAGEPESTMEDFIDAKKRLTPKELRE